MHYKPDIGESVFVLAETAIFYGVVVERREIENASGTTEAFLVEYYDNIAPEKYAAAVFGREQLETGDYGFGIGRSWLVGPGKEARAFAERRAEELRAEIKAAA